MEIVVAGKKISNIKEITSVESMINDFSKVDQAMTEASKACEAFAKFSDTKAMESFGYKATEAVGENIVNGAKFVGNKIREFIRMVVQKIAQFIQYVRGGILKTRASAILKQLQANPNVDFKKANVTGNEKLTNLQNQLAQVKQIISSLGQAKNVPPAIMQAAGILERQNPNISSFEALTACVDSIINFGSAGGSTDVKVVVTSLANLNAPILKNLQDTANSMKQIEGQLQSAVTNSEQQKDIQNIAKFGIKWVGFVISLCNTYLSLVAETIKDQQVAAQPQQQNAQPAPATTQQPTAPVNA